MKCQNCGENEANVKYTQIINGVKKQMSLCDKCAKELGLEDINFSMPISFSSFLGDMFDLYDNDMPVLTIPKTLTCDKCNTTLEEFLNTGEFGCDNCYETFKTRLESIFKNIHGTSKHIGRVGKYISRKTKDMDKKITEKVFDKKESEEKINKKEDVKQNLKDDKQSKIEELEARLKEEIKEERYEDAAKTRDEIKKLK